MAPDSFLTRAGMRFRWRRSRRHDPAAGLGDLEAALKDDGCPVCARAAGADERWLDRFLDDGYLERDVDALHRGKRRVLRVPCRSH